MTRGASQQFLAFGQATAGCASVASNLTSTQWSVSDQQNVTISNTPGPTYGSATCLDTTAGPVTVTATVPAGHATVSGTATLSCQ